MRYITNDTASPLFVAGRLIPPYDGRHFEDHELPPELQAAKPAEEAPAGPSLDEQLQEIRGGTIKEITPQLEGLTFEALERLGTLEVDAGDAARKGLLAAIDAEKLRRGSVQLDKDQAEQNAAALEAARGLLLQARVAQMNLSSPLATEAERSAADAAVEEAEAKVAALTPTQE